jgi:arylformamidase
MKIIDLSTPIVEGHLRWPVEKTTKGDLDKGDVFQVTTIRLTCHGFSHVDARRHMVAGAETIEATPLEAVVGACAVVDLTDAKPSEALDAARLSARTGHVRAGDIVLLKTCWDTQRAIHEASFWREAPYLTRDAAEHLRALNIRSLAVDFPQDYTIRLLLDGIMRPVEEHVTHDVLLRHGVTLIEYVVNTKALSASRLFFSAAPLKIPGADGAPARVYAVEGLLPTAA